MTKKVRQQQSRKVYKTVGSQQGMQLNTAESNAKGDKMAVLASIGLLCASVASAGLGLYFSAIHFMPAVSKPPIDWNNVIWAVFVLTVSFIFARSLLWLSFFGSSMMAAKSGAWSSLETIARRAIRYHKVLPNGSPWASLVLAQSLMARGKFKEAVEAADEEWTRNGQNKKQAQNIGPLCAAAGMAAQAEGETKTTLLWNDRAIETINNVFTQMEKPKKSIMEKISAVQGDQWLSQMRIHLAAAYFGNANVYFSSQDFRRAKENYRKAVDQAMKGPDFPNKQDIIKISNEQIARLKHY